MGNKGPVLGLGASGPEGLEPKYNTIQFNKQHIGLAVKIGPLKQEL